MAKAPGKTGSTRGATHARRMDRGADDRRNGPPPIPTNDATGFAMLGWQVGPTLNAQRRTRGDR